MRRCRVEVLARAYQGVMLSIGKLRAGQEDYYLAAVGHGVEDYYSEAGEVPGRWVGVGADELGLVGEVADDEFRLVLSGVDPYSGERLRRANARVPGFDLTLSAPKSVSLLWALGDRDTAEAVVEAHQHAVDETIGYLEREAVRSRRGHNGRDTVAGAGVVGAAFRHRTSRAGDPQLHTHVVVANATLCDDGKWRALDGRHVYAQALTAGHLYQAELRLALAQSLGVAWEDPVRGMAEIVGFSHEVLREFSRRRIEIEYAAALIGDESVPTRRRLAIETRAAKDYHVDTERLWADWRHRADLYGLDRTKLAELSRPQHSSQQVSAPRTLAVDDERFGRVLSYHDATFDRRMVLQLLAHRAPQGATIDELETRADRYLASGHVVPVGVALTGVQYATPEHLAREQRVLDTVAERRDGRYAVCADPTPILDAATLSDEQRAMVMTPTTGGDGVSVVVGAAGTGKTHALRVAREIWERDRYQVIGCALAARTAAYLQAATGIPSCSLDRLLAIVDHRGATGLQPRTVLVVDEAAMVDTHRLARLCSHTAHTKVVLVGDHHQLPAIEAGGTFAALARGPDTIRLRENRRQTDPAERAALAELRVGDTTRAVEILNAAGRVHDHTTKDDARARMVEHWLDEVLDGNNALMLAVRRDDVAELNQHARTVMRAEGAIEDDALVVAGRAYAVGDWVMTLTNDYRLGVLNGQRGSIIDIDPQGCAMTVALDDNTTTTIPADYLEAGGVDHAYAITIHKAQGQTCDIALVLGGSELYREAGYSALTRGRHENHLYTAAPEPDDDAHTEPEDGYTTVLHALQRTRQHVAAIEVLRTREAARPSPSHTVDDDHHHDIGLEW